MNKQNVWILALLLTLALGAFLLVPRTEPEPFAAPASSYVIITVAGEEQARIPLSEPRTLAIRQESGAENILEITPEGVVMLSSTCENQLCVHMGQVTEENWEYRPNGAFIICLPNQVSAELVVVE